MFVFAFAFDRDWVRLRPQPPSSFPPSPPPGARPGNARSLLPGRCQWQWGPLTLLLGGGRRGLVPLGRSSTRRRVWWRGGLPALAGGKTGRRGGGGGGGFLRRRVLSTGCGS